MASKKYSIYSVLALVDKMSAPLVDIDNAINRAADSMTDLENASNFDTTMFDDMRNKVNEVKNMTSSIQKMADKIDQIENNIVINININFDGLNKDIAKIEETVNTITDKNVEVNVSTNSNTVTNEVSKIENTLVAIDNKKVDIDIIANTQDAIDDIDKIKDSIISFNDIPKIDLSYIFDGNNQNLTNLNKISTILNNIKSVITNIGKKAINFTTNTKNLISANTILNNVKSTMTSIGNKTITFATNVKNLISAKTVLNTIKTGLEDIKNLQEKWNSSISSSTSLLNKLSGVVGAYVSLMKAKQVINLSDTISQNNARLSLIVDDNNTIDTLNEKIFIASQNARADYLNMSSMVASISTRASDAFTSNDEVIAFTEQISKMYAIAGATTMEMEASMLQLTQALGSGVLRGEELNSVFEASPNIIQQIADYMEVPIGQIRDMASEGLISAEIVKNAILSATAFDYTSQFDSMPKTFAQIFTQIKNEAILAFDPIFTKLSELANSERFDYFVSAVIIGLQNMSVVAINIFDKLITAGNYVYDNWSKIAPIVTNVAIAFGILAVTFNTLQAIVRVVTIVQTLYKATLLGCPILWIIAGIIAIITVIYLVINAINSLTGTTISATGVIVGILSVGAAFIGNLFFGLWNMIVDGGVIVWNFFAAFGNFIGNFLNNPISAVIRLVANMVDTVLNLLQGVASALDMVFGTNFAKGLQTFRNNLKSGVDSLIGEETIYVEYLNGDDYKLDRLAYGEAYTNGYNFVDNIEQTITGIFDMSGLEGVGDYTSNLEFPEVPDYSSLSDLEYLDELNNASSFPEIPEEDLKYLKDIAERDVINRFTTAQVNVDLGGVTNNVNNNNDLDGFIDYLANGVEEALEKTADGVYV